MKSHMITDRNDIPKPWTDKPNPRAKIAYFLTYAVILVGLAGGAVQCYLNFVRAQLDKKPLCLVMEENFDSEDAVFGENGSFNREVTMDGFGYVLSLLSSPSFLDPMSGPIVCLILTREETPITKPPSHFSDLPI
jgi:hypothetical protein